jgi:hypothetical protein
LQSQKQRGLNIDGEIAGLRKKRPVFNPTLINKGVGSWEKHTRGIGAKLLLQVFSETLREVDYVLNYYCAVSLHLFSIPNKLVASILMHGRNKPRPVLLHIMFMYLVITPSQLPSQ